MLLCLTTNSYFRIFFPVWSIKGWMVKNEVANAWTKFWMSENQFKNDKKFASATHHVWAIEIRASRVIISYPNKNRPSIFRKHGSGSKTRLFGLFYILHYVPNGRIPIVEKIFWQRETGQRLEWVFMPTFDINNVVEGSNVVDVVGLVGIVAPSTVHNKLELVTTTLKLHRKLPQFPVLWRVHFDRLPSVEWTSKLHFGAPMGPSKSDGGTHRS